jgi:hypothetical protein
MAVIISSLDEAFNFLTVPALFYCKNNSFESLNQLQKIMHEVKEKAIG